MQPNDALPASCRRVADALSQAGLARQIVMLPDAARTAQDAAEAVKVDVGQIVKSLVFRGKQSGRGVFVAVSGRNRADMHKLAALAEEPIDKADADFVRATTGFAIGGVSPVAHLQPMFTLIDRSLLDWPELWAAGGHPHAVFPLSPQELVTLTGGTVADVAA